MIVETISPTVECANVYVKSPKTKVPTQTDTDTCAKTHSDFLSHWCLVKYSFGWFEMSPRLWKS